MTQHRSAVEDLAQTNGQSCQMLNGPSVEQTGIARESRNFNFMAEPVAPQYDGQQLRTTPTSISHAETQGARTCSMITTDDQFQRIKASQSPPLRLEVGSQTIAPAGYAADGSASFQDVAAIQTLPYLHAVPPWLQDSLASCLARTTGESPSALHCLHQMQLTPITNSHLPSLNSSPASSSCYRGELALWKSENSSPLPTQGNLPVEAVDSYERTVHSAGLTFTSKQLRLDDERAITQFLQSSFEDMKQLPLKAILKKWIHGICPHKQSRYPYKGSNPRWRAGKGITDEDQSRPPWWPPFVRHIEPDHGSKSERMELAMWLIRLRDPALASGRGPGSWTKTLRRSTTGLEFRHLVRNGDEANARIQCILSDIYRIAEFEEMFQASEIGDTTLIEVREFPPIRRCARRGGRQKKTMDADKAVPSGKKGKGKRSNESEDAGYEIALDGMSRLCSENSKNPGNSMKQELVVVEIADNSHEGAPRPSSFEGKHNPSSISSDEKDDARDLGDPSQRQHQDSCQHNTSRKRRSNVPQTRRKQRIYKSKESQSASPNQRRRRKLRNVNEEQQHGLGRREADRSTDCLMCDILAEKCRSNMSEHGWSLFPASAKDHVQSITMASPEMQLANRMDWQIVPQVLPSQSFQGQLNVLQQNCSNELSGERTAPYSDPDWVWV
ncbi:MAG: hypothetical protein M1820_004801 [Bogoriella megaspora]|nr:MAG: hypothetical protein M1820_004801 [Bogoriella megaspora]